MSTDLASSALQFRVFLEKSSDIALQTQRGQGLDEILQTAIDYLRSLFKADRVVIYRFLPDQDALITCESVNQDCTPLIGQLIYDPCLNADWVARYQQGQTSMIADALDATVDPCYASLLARLEVRANLVVPVFNHNQVWGLLIIHDCHTPRLWSALEVQMVQHIALQLGIATQQTAYPSQVQNLKPPLESSTELQKAMMAIQANQDAVWDWDIASNHVWYSPRWKQLRGFASDAVGPSREEWVSGIHPADFDRVSQAVQTHLDDPSSAFEQEYRVRHRDGSYRWVLDRGQAIRNAAGTIVRMIGTETDITAKKQAELSLQQQIQREHTLHQVMQVIHSCSSLDAAFVASAACIAESLEGAVTIAQYLPERDTWRHRVLYDRMTPPITHLETEISAADYPLAAPLKQLQVVQSNYTPPTTSDNHSLMGVGSGCWLLVPISVDGSLWGSLSLSRLPQTQPWQPEDVELAQRVADQLAIAVQQTQLYQQLQLSKQQYQNLVENSPDIIERFDPQFRHLYVSSALTKITGIPTESFLGKSCRELGMDMVMVDTWEAAAETVLATGCKQVIKFIAPTLKGIRSFEMVIAPEFSESQEIESLLCISRDVTDRKAVKNALREQQQFTEQIAQSTLAILYVYNLVEQRNAYSNQQIETVLGYSPAEIQAMGDRFFETLLHPDDLPQVMTNQQRLLQLNDDGFVETEYRMQHKSGDYRWLLSRDRIFSRNADGTPRESLGVATDITVQKETQAVLHQQAERQRLLSEVAKHIRQTLDLDQILQTTVTEVRQFLHTDRVIIYQFNPDWSGTIIAESVTEEWKSILGMQITDTYFVETKGQSYYQRALKATNDIYQAGLDLCHIALLEQMQVRAKLVVPIQQDDHLWGLLVAQHCRSPRQWEALEVELQQQLATQLAIAIQQSELYQQVQTLNANLELQVQERTAQLQQALNVEALLKSINDQIRDSLDEEKILKQAVKELTLALEADCCDSTIYSEDSSAVTVKYEYTQEGGAAQNSMCLIADSSDPNLYVQLLQGHCIQFCLLGPNVLRPGQPPKAILACPIADDQGILGDLWLFCPATREFNELEVRLVQQVASQCAIALRQSCLYQASQQQVKELERLNQLKDDFLSTVSHELRSPMASIKMATQMLEISLTPLGLLTDATAPLSRYFRILQEESEREINLINDLLDLARLDTSTEPLNLAPVTLQLYIPYLTQTFGERAQQQQQLLVTQIPEHLPELITDLPFLERILTELLHNACKYTPAGETIVLSAQLTATGMQIQISNTGVEIAAAECDRIFDKFYRIPNNDPWKHGGTGLGLALVKKLTEHLGGQIQVIGRDRQTTFTLVFPWGETCKDKAGLADFRGAGDQ